MMTASKILIEFLQINSCQLNQTLKLDSQSTLLVMNLISSIMQKIFIMLHTMTQTTTQQLFMMVMKLIKVTSLWLQLTEQTHLLEATMYSFKLQLWRKKWPWPNMLTHLTGHGIHSLKDMKRINYSQIDSEFHHGITLKVGMFKLIATTHISLTTNSIKLMMNTWLHHTLTTMVKEKIHLTDMVMILLTIGAMDSIMNLNIPTHFQMVLLEWKNLNSSHIQMKMEIFVSDLHMFTLTFMFMQFTD